MKIRILFVIFFALLVTTFAFLVYLTVRTSNSSGHSSIIMAKELSEEPATYKELINPDECVVEAMEKAGKDEFGEGVHIPPGRLSAILNDVGTGIVKYNGTCYEIGIWWVTEEIVKGTNAMWIS